MTYKIAVFFECGMYFMWITWLLCSAHRLGTIGLGALRSELGDGAERRRQRRRRRHCRRRRDVRRRRRNGRGAAADVGAQVLAAAGPRVRPVRRRHVIGQLLGVDRHRFPIGSMRRPMQSIFISTSIVNRYFHFLAT